MMNRALVIDRTLKNELEKNSTAVVAKLKAELDESSNSMKVTLEAMGSLEEQSCKVKSKLDDVRAWTTTLEAELKTIEQGRADVTKAQEEESTKRAALADELAHYQSFLLRVDKEGLNQAIHLAKFFNGIPVNDDRYADSKDIVNDQLVSADGEDEEEAT